MPIPVCSCALVSLVRRTCYVHTASEIATVGVLGMSSHPNITLREEALTGVPPPCLTKRFGRMRSEPLAGPWRAILPANKLSTSQVSQAGPSWRVVLQNLFHGPNRPAEEKQPLLLSRGEILWISQSRVCYNVIYIGASYQCPRCYRSRAAHNILNALSAHTRAPERRPHLICLQAFGG